MPSGSPAQIGGPCVLIAAHPDDETIGFSVNLARLGSACTLVTVTDGAPRNGIHARALGFASPESYARARRAELLAAVSYAGVSAEQCLAFDVPDQQVVNNLVPVTLALLGVLADLAPRSVVTHAYEGGHPDHDAVAATVHFAVAILMKRGGPVPELYEFSGYNFFSGQKQYLRFLPDTTGATAEHTIVLDEEQRMRKHQMFACYRSQQSVLEKFSIDIERHRHSPGYDFSRPPHFGTLLYERNGIGPDGVMWRSEVETARKHLFGSSAKTAGGSADIELARAGI